MIYYGCSLNVCILKIMLTPVFRPWPQLLMYFYASTCFSGRTTTLNVLQIVHSLRPCDVYTSANWVIIGSGNGLSADRHQVITEPLFTSCQWDSFEQILEKLESRCTSFIEKKSIKKCRLQNVPFYPGRNVLNEFVSLFWLPQLIW